jgi:HSP20 family protein
MAVPVRRSQSTASLGRGWDPLQQLEELQSRMSQLMQGVWPGAAETDAGPWTPFVDLEETDDAWIVEAEVPGARREDINVELRDSELVIRGEIKEREHTGVMRRRERRVGEFEYAVTLPGDADPQAVQASLDDGILRVRVPKRRERETRRIEIGS